MEKIDTIEGKTEMLHDSKQELQELQLMKIMKSLLERTASEKDNSLNFATDGDKSSMERLLNNYLGTRDGFLYMDDILTVHGWDRNYKLFYGDFVKMDLVNDLKLFLDEQFQFYHFEVTSSGEVDKSQLRYTVGVCKKEEEAMKMCDLSTERHQIFKVYRNKKGKIRYTKIFPSRS